MLEHESDTVAYVYLNRSKKFQTLLKPGED